MKNFYITTSIVYTNALPHIGFALELIQADAFARYKRKRDKVFFLTGADEHGLKNARKAREEGKEPQEFCDEIVKKYKELNKLLCISNDEFIRTSDQENHWPAVFKLWQKLKEKGDIYEKEYEGLYCVGCEAFVTKKDLIDGKCPFHDKTPEEIKEKNLFFKLSKYSKEIKEAIESDSIKITPEKRKKEFLSFLEDGLKDISFSRPKEKINWGIPVPDNNDQLVYVWADALTNYLSGIGYGRDEDFFNKNWPADVHFIGKDISKFHALIWPGMLLSAGLDLPKEIFIHGFLTVDGQKMSKSLGNTIDPFDLISRYGGEAVRYYFLSEISSTEDGDFSHERFRDRYNADLAGGIGNLNSRIITLAQRKKEELKGLDNQGIQDSNLSKEIERARQEWQESFKEYKFNMVASSIKSLVSCCDKIIEEKKPWQESKEQLAVINDLIVALEVIAELIEPLLPETSLKIIDQIDKKEAQPLFKKI